jgi:hypothetical protein
VQGPMQLAVKHFSDYLQRANARFLFRRKKQNFANFASSRRPRFVLAIKNNYAGERKRERAREREREGEREIEREREEGESAESPRRLTLGRWHSANALKAVMFLPAEKNAPSCIFHFQAKSGFLLPLYLSRSSPFSSRPLT